MTEESNSDNLDQSNLENWINPYFWGKPNWAHEDKEIEGKLEKIKDSFIYLNTPQLCSGDEHETDTRLLETISDKAKFVYCKSLSS